MRRPQTSISEVEFESLPPALRRKYFSSLERLRLAQDGISPPPPRSSHTHRPPSTAYVGTLPLPSADDLDRRLRRSSTASRSRLRKVRSLVAPDLVTPEKAAWFASLPPVVQRKHFSREEQILFASERHSTILDAADEVLHRRGWQDSRLDTPVLPFTRPRTSYFPETSSITSSTFEPIDEMAADYSVDSVPWLDDQESLDLRLDDYHTEIAEIGQRQQATQKRRSFRRHISLSNLSLNRSSASSPLSSYVMSGSATPSMQFNNGRPISQASVQLRPRDSVSSIDPHAAHYQDPAARMKLRVYLATASKFDEAVEFGFPSTQENARLDKSRPTTSARTTKDSGRTFYSDDTPSLSGDEGDEREEWDYINDPRTPDESMFRESRRSHKPSQDRAVIRPQYTRPVTEGYAQANAMDREMTLHMTLTRPDLRSPDESRPRTVHVNALPLEQADLNVDNPVSIWDTLPSEESKVRRFLKKLKLK